MDSSKNVSERTELDAWQATEEGPHLHEKKKAILVRLTMDYTLRRLFGFRQKKELTAFQPYPNIHQITPELFNGPSQILITI